MHVLQFILLYFAFILFFYFIGDVSYDFNFAALACGLNAEYSYKQPCSRTCQHDPQLPVPCSEAAIWVCMCKDGFVLR